MGNGRSDGGSHRNKGFTLVEVLVVMLVISVLVGLLLPAVQMAREASRHSHCKNNLKQIGAAIMLHENTLTRLPSGGWGGHWVGDPDRGSGPWQPGGWVYQILPYMDYHALYEFQFGDVQVTSSGSDPSADVVDRNALAARLQATQVPGFNCASRRSRGPYPHTVPETVINSDATEVDARCDYAANGGDFVFDAGAGPDLARIDSYRWPLTKKCTGVIFMRSSLSLDNISDGKPHTYLVAEKYLDPNHYDDGLDPGDDFSMYSGHSSDTIRWAVEPTSPCRDQAGLANDEEFGSAHPGSFNAVFCDGSVRPITYDIDPEIHRRMANREDGGVVDIVAR